MLPVIHAESALRDAATKNANFPHVVKYSLNADTDVKRQKCCACGEVWQRQITPNTCGHQQGGAFWQYCNTHAAREPTTAAAVATDTTNDILSKCQNSVIIIFMSVKKHCRACECSHFGGHKLLSLKSITQLAKLWKLVALAA